jgi:hypothetical protein
MKAHVSIKKYKMKSRFFLQPLVFLGLLILAFSCKKTENETGDNPGGGGNVAPIGSSKNRPGLGNSAGLPEGVDLQLPPCVRIVDRPNYRFNVNETKIYGFTETFYVPVSFVNTCADPATVELNDGLILISEFQEGQNGLLVERVRVNVPPSHINGGGAADTTTIYLAVSCLNEKKAPPISRFSPDYNIGDFGYRVGKVTNDPNLLQFLALLKDKTGLRVSSFILNHPPDPDQETPLRKMYAEIQGALWEITDGDGLTAAEVKKLKDKLEKYK